VVYVEEEMVCKSLMRFVQTVGSSLLAITLLTSCSIMETTPITAASALRMCALGASAPDCPPASPREFRAVWVATVANIDWPTKPGLPDAQQQAEALAILNRVQALNMNAVLLQVRPGADAIYPSQLEPWAEWLTGEQGKSPGYDPLAFWITEAKKRGIEVHAWFNPYRARHTKAMSTISRDHVANRLPNAVKSYGGFLWLDPGERAAQDHSYSVIMDVLRRYDIDGVHFDDYFYPYPVVETPAMQQPTTPQNAVANALNQATPQAPSVVTVRPEREVDFPDEPSWQAYVAGGGKLARADWRRDNVNRFVERVYKSVKAEKPWVRFGISPFGIGRPDRRPPGIVGFSQYDKLYADVELWLQRGWLDYLAPQLYWAIDQTPQAFGTLLDYWHAQNTSKRDIFPGLYTSRIEDTPRGWLPKEIENQIVLMRAKRDVALGHIHFSTAPVMQNRRDLNASLSTLYARPALPFRAQSNWGIHENNVIFNIATELNDRPDYLGVQIKSSNAFFSGKNGVSRGGHARLLALNLRYGSTWQFATLPVGETNGELSVTTSIAKSTKEGALNAIAVSLVDRYGREGTRYVRDMSAATP
jgi:uncharacterized lipoprotein YddW (UPF0748 family)